MLKKLTEKIARKILKEELENTEQYVESLTLSEKRLSETVNKLKTEKFNPRKYVFAPQALTQEEQQIIGDFVETPVIDLITKWFKYQADRNNDMLLHSKGNSEQEALWKMAVLVYDDWKMFLERCKQVCDKSVKSKPDK